ncbi:hypothetical protein EV714DRAFT_283299 [Schizophyllum commune]
MSPWNDATKFMRIAALAIFVYDWALTLPGEIRMYRRQRSITRMSTACLMLILVRYLGLIALVTNFIGFFAHFFVELPKNAPYDACRSYFRVMPIMQCFASWASHAVFVVRTVAICDLKRTGTIALSALAAVVSGVEIFAQLYSFYKFDVGSSGNCLLQYSDDHNLSYLYYLVRDPPSAVRNVRPDRHLQASTIFDVVIVVLTYRGLAVKHFNRSQGNNDGSTPAFNDVLWNSSMLYFAVTTFFNILNLCFYAYYGNSNATVLGAMGIAFTSMMSARVILDLHSYVHRPTTSFQISGLRSNEQGSMSRTSGVPYQGKGTFNGSDQFISDSKMRDSGIGVFRTVETTEYSYDSGRRVRDSVV